MKKFIIFMIMIVSAFAIKPIDLLDQKAKFDVMISNYSKINTTYNFRIIYTFRYEDNDEPCYVVSVTKDSNPTRVMEVQTLFYTEVLIIFSEDNVDVVNNHSLEYYDAKGNYRSPDGPFEYSEGD